LFDQQVLGLMMYTTVEHADSEEKVSVVANVAFGYGVLKHCGKTVQSRPMFADDAKVRTLKFSNCWAQGYIRRVDLHQHKVCTTEKLLPAVTEVQTTMEVIQAEIVTGEFTEDEIVSFGITAAPITQLRSRGWQTSGESPKRNCRRT